MKKKLINKIVIFLINQIGQNQICNYYDFLLMNRDLLVELCSQISSSRID